MTCRIRRLSSLALLILVAATCPGNAGLGPVPSPVPTPVPTPAGVVLRFHNGSVVQPAVLLDAVEMETKLGKLSIPANEVRRIDFGFRLSEEDAAKLERALRDLGSNKFQAREAATKTLMGLGRRAYPALLESRKNADLETTKRVEAILKDIKGRVPTDRLLIRRTDVVRTSDSTVAGQITTAVLRIRCDLFGEVKLPVVQMRELRSLLPGGDLTVTVDASKHGAKTAWLETDFEMTTATRLHIAASGEINLDPMNRLGNNFTRGVRPDGTIRLNSGDIALPGKLLGRIGTEGPTFEIGSRYSATPEREGKLFLRIVTLQQSSNIRAEGSYQVRISSEPN